MQLKEVEGKLAKLNEDAAAWSEFKNPEGRVYFYNSKTTDSTWDRPIVFRDVVGKTSLLCQSFFIRFDNDLDMENQLENINKTMHESEKEVKRLESEQSQLPAATPAEKQPQQAAAPTPAFLNNFTLEKLDNTEARRLVRSNKVIFSSIGSPLHRVMVH